MQASEPVNISDHLLRLSFWALGDLHYRAVPAWNELHLQRLTPLFEDLHALWGKEGAPAFCVSPGDIVDTCALTNYEFARAALERQLGDILFYPGIGNHEYYGLESEDPDLMAETFTSVWEKPLRYAWRAGDVICIMLDYPDPFKLQDPALVFISQEALTFLDKTLAENAADPAIIFLHCPLRNTVLDRDPEQYRDYNSLQSFFSPENSQEVRDILARHSNACLFLSGHTHSGWEAPNLVVTETLGGHPVTFVNLMSPWYTGTHTGPRLSQDQASIQYVPDDPDVVTSFSVRVYHEQASIRVREHRTHRWLKEWIVPIKNKP
ncbi:MAG TPA: metallophosphoesterase [Ktedonobacteraceae bacterium]|nr:metallophosphoesterase [Ktedonobacteraceae bacterium]